MSGCRVDRNASPQFNKLREHWKNSGYPTIDTDLADAFQAISRDVQANHCRRVPRFSEALGDFLLLKYRQKNKGAREGSRGGWRFYALFDKKTATLYPIIVYPKKDWDDATEELITASVQDLVAIIGPSTHS